MFLQTIKFNTTVPSSFRHSLCLLLHGIPLLHLVSIIFDRQHRHFLCHVCLSLSGFFSDLLLLQCGLDFEQRSFSDVVGSLECVELFLRRRRRKNETLFKIIHPLPERGCHWRVRRVSTFYCFFSIHRVKNSDDENIHRISRAPFTSTISRLTVLLFKRIERYFMLAPALSPCSGGSKMLTRSSRIVDKDTIASSLEFSTRNYEVI